MAQYLYGAVAARDAIPPTVIDPKSGPSGTQTFVGTFELDDTGNGDSGIFLPISVEAVLPSIKLAFDDLGTAGTVDIGLFKKEVDGTYTAVDADCFANNIDVNSAAVGFTEYRFSIKGIETVAQKAWALAGLSSRPAYAELFFGVTTDTGTTAAGTVSYIITVNQ
jgi:hypothetical protein